MMWLPVVTAWRGKKQTWALRRAQRKNNCGFYPYRILDEDSSRIFCKRDKTQLPVAEDFLTLDTSLAQIDNPESDLNMPGKPWRYGPLQGEIILKLIHQIELGFFSKH